MMCGLSFMDVGCRDEFGSSGSGGMIRDLDGEALLYPPRKAGAVPLRADADGGL